MRHHVVALAAATALGAVTAGVVAEPSPCPFAWPTPLPTTAPAPQPTVLWERAPAASFSLDVRPLDITPDGEARALVRVVLHDGAGAPAPVRHGTDFDYFASRGSVQWQTLLRYGSPAAIVSVRDDGPVNVRVIANRPQSLAAQRASFDTRRWRLPRVAGAAVGPALVRLGWFPQVRRGEVRVYRLSENGGRVLAATLRAPSSSWDDVTVHAAQRRHYLVVLPRNRASRVDVDVPQPLPLTTVDTIRGKSAWLAFSGDRRDDDGFDKIDVPQIVDTASRAGLRSIELRLAYGAFDEVTPKAKATIDALIDGLAARGIRTIGWTVPRANTFEDLARNVAIAAYRTPAGNGITGLAVDLERGDEFLGDGPAGYRALRTYLEALRRASGPGVLLIATVEDPFLEHLDQTAFPYRDIARQADVLQSMTYLRMLGPWDSPDKASRAVAASAARIRQLAGRAVALDIGLQTGVLSKRGAPPAAELRAAVDASRKTGAIGVILYDWTGTGPEQWSVIADTAW